MPSSKLSNGLPIAITLNTSCGGLANHHLTVPIHSQLVADEFPKDGRANVATRSPRRAMYEGNRCDNRDVSKWIEYEQIIIAGEDQISVAIHGQFQKLVIFGITARREPLSDGYQFRRCHQLKQSIPRVD